VDRSQPSSLSEFFCRILRL